MRPVVADLECFYDPKNTRGDKKLNGEDDPYTLSKMTTEAYVRDRRWNMHGVAMKWSAGTSAIWYDEREFRYIVKNEDWSDVFLVSHHANFDHLAFSHHYDIHPRMSGCTLSMARLRLGNHISVSLDSVRSQFGIPAKTTPYGLMEGRYWADMDQATRQLVADGAIDEVESIWKIFGMLMAGGFPPEELDVVDSTIKMFTEPELLGDSAVFARVWKEEVTRKAELMQRLGVTTAELGSNERFTGLLLARGIEPEMKPGKPNPDGSEKLIPAFAKTDPFMEELQNDEDPEVRALAEARLGAKSTLLQTRAETMGWMVSRGRVCVYLRYAGALTSRWSGSDDTNFQNWTNGSEINTALVTPDGWLLAEPDASQIECVAHNEIVLTDNGPKAIQNVQLTDRVWDGTEWVAHEGVIYKGTKQVISYQGLTCTPDHIVYVRGDRGEEKMEMRIAAASSRDLVAAGSPAPICQKTLWKSVLRKLQDIRRSGDKVQIQIGSRSRDLGSGELATQGLYRGRNRSQGQRRPLRTWKSAIINAAGKCKQSLYDLLGPRSRWASCYAEFQASPSRMRVWTRSGQGARRSWTDRRTDHRALSQRPLENDMAETASPWNRSRSGFKTEKEAIAEQTPVFKKVYDIINAGPRHRFVASGVIVSNCRLLNFCAGQWDKVEEFRSGADPYVAVASAFYKMSINKKDHPNERQLGKIVELQAGYGSGGNKIRSTVRVKSEGKIILTPAQGVEARDAYRDTHLAISNKKDGYWKQAEWCLKRMANFESYDWGPFRIRCNKDKSTRRLVLPNGIEIIYDTLMWYTDNETGDRYWRLKTRKGWVKMYGSKLVENMIQALARIVVSQAMLRLKKLGYRCKNTKHDSLWLLIPENDGRLEEHKQVILAEMSRELPWLPGCPLAAEFKMLGKRYQ
jgi:hypothetical protein